MSITEQGILAGRYRLQRRVGGGGMGAVWEAYDQELDRPVAIKIPDRSLAADESFVERFRREARSAGRLSHPNVAQVYDYGMDDGQPYLVMELVPGETLASRLAREGPLPSEDARRIAAGVADALHAAHEGGVVHRDVKPGNIMLTPEGGVKVMDFGIAAAAADGRMTGTGQVLGTPAYMAPEQAAGKGATPASDVYALGVVLYEMLAGRAPFAGDTALAVASAHLHRDPEPLQTAAPEADPEAVEAVNSAMAKDPADRPATAAAMATMLRGDAPPTEASTAVLAAGASTEAMAMSPTERLDGSGTGVLPGGPVTEEPETAPPAPARRRRGVAGWVVAVAALVAVGIVLIVLAMTLSGGGAENQLPRPPSLAPQTTPAPQKSSGASNSPGPGPKGSSTAPTTVPPTTTVVSTPPTTLPTTTPAPTGTVDISVAPSG
jgi:serine/threonine protein kinase